MASDIRHDMMFMCVLFVLWVIRLIGRLCQALSPSVALSTRFHTHRISRDGVQAQVHALHAGHVEAIVVIHT